MNKKRIIRQDEKELILFLLSKINSNIKNHPIGELVEEYEGGIMGSISMGNPEECPYLGDLIQARYTDIDGKEVVITLTEDANHQLLDLDFWKVDFSKLLKYPSPSELVFEN